jgi:hypothetical protein
VTPRKTRLAGVHFAALRVSGMARDCAPVRALAPIACNPRIKKATARSTKRRKKRRQNFTMHCSKNR